MNLSCNNGPGSRQLLPEVSSMNTAFQLTIAPQLVARTRFSPPLPKQDLCLSVPEAMEQLAAKMQSGCSSLDSVIIAGPGDPLATSEITIEAITRLKTKYPELHISIHTYGIGASKLATRLAHAGVNHVEIAVEAVRSAVIEKLFAWIRPGTKTLRLSDAAHLLIQEQSSAVSALKFSNIRVTVATTLYPGYNIDHVGKISREMKEFGADGIAIIPYSPAPGVEVELESPTSEELIQAKKMAAASLPVVEPLLDPSTLHNPVKRAIDNPSVPALSNDRPYVAVVSSNGIEIDLHLGHAIRFLIYGRREDGLACLLETREAPEPGSGKDRWLQVGDILHDCSLLLTASAGENPRRILAENGIRVVVTEENIEGIVDVLYGGGKKRKKA